MKKFVIRKRQGVYALQLNDILYMEKKLRKIKVYVDITCCPGESTIEFYGKFPEVMMQLDNRFMYCHRSYVINMDKIIIMSDNRIYMTNNQDVYMGRNTFFRAKKIFNSYLKKKFG